MTMIDGNARRDEPITHAFESNPRTYRYVRLTFVWQNKKGEEDSSPFELLTSREALKPVEGYGQTPVRSCMGQV